MAFALVVVGASLGGLHALEILLAGLPAHFPLPVAIGQHRREDADDVLCAALRRRSTLPVGEAEDKEAIVPGRVYVAPAGYHLLVEEGRFALSTEAPVAYARPSIDVNETAAIARPSNLETTGERYTISSAADGYPGTILMARTTRSVSNPGGKGKSCMKSH